MILLIIAVAILSGIVGGSHKKAKVERRKAEERFQKIEKEQRKQALAIEKLEMRVAACENEISFNREQRDRLFQLLELEEKDRAAAVPGSPAWRKHHSKVITLEGKIHTVQKRIDKAQTDKWIAEQQIAV